MKVIEIKNSKGELHNENGPAYVDYYENDIIHSKQYWVNDERHNENGPADIFYDKCGKILLEMYYENNKLHRDNGPAIIEYFENGQIKFCSYYKNGQKHNENGPADIHYDKGRILSKSCWIDGSKTLSNDKVIIKKDNLGNERQVRTWELGWMD